MVNLLNQCCGAEIIHFQFRLHFPKLSTFGSGFTFVPKLSIFGFGFTFLPHFGSTPQYCRAGSSGDEIICGGEGTCFNSGFMKYFWYKKCLLALAKKKGIFLDEPGAALALIHRTLYRFNRACSQNISHQDSFKKRTNININTAAV